MNEIVEGLVENVAEGIFDSYVESLSINRDDSIMQEVVQAYKKEMLQWFDQEGLEKENPMRYASQEQWYSLYLEKKRLVNRGCKMQYVTYKHEPERYLEKPETTCFYKKDGKYIICEARQRTSIKKQYMRNGALLGQKARTCNIGYHILRSQNENGQYICPNCGAEQDLDKLLDGCDYCKSKFDISAYEDKVVSVMYNQNAFDYREGNSSYAVVMALSIVGVVFGLVGVCFSGGLSLGMAVLGGFGIYKGIQMAKESTRGLQTSMDSKSKIKEHIPNFSEEEFIGSLDCKLKSIHYASDARELDAFVKCDITPYLQEYQALVNCETGKISYKDYRVEGDYQYIDLHREIEVLKDCGNRVVLGKGVVAVTLAKKIVSRLKNDVTLFRCGGCGATVSLVEGGKCKHCGNEMDYAAYDWVVVGYKHVGQL